MAASYPSSARMRSRSNSASRLDTLMSRRAASTLAHRAVSSSSATVRFRFSTKSV